ITTIFIISAPLTTNNQEKANILITSDTNPSPENRIKEIKSELTKNNTKNKTEAIVVYTSIFARLFSRSLEHVTLL
ncbi:hypothetical protein CGI63_23860, partial [Vibrio parahaemolyticus]|uniref:hypothetical protein n=1 Tax=Vibrio parahaemolyticus TaxID=670 RepID=UPI0011744332